MLVCTSLMTFISAAVSLGLCRWGGKFYWSSKLSSNFLKFSFVTAVSCAFEMDWNRDEHFVLDRNWYINLCFAKFLGVNKYLL